MAKKIICLLFGHSIGEWVYRQSDERRTWDVSRCRRCDEFIGLAEK
jgi:hypothetical protein